MTYRSVRLGGLIKLVDKRNRDNNFSLSELRGVDKNKNFIRTVASTDNLDLSKYKIIDTGQFVFSGMQTGRDKCIRVSLNNESSVIVSPAYTVFEVNDAKEILPDYLMVYFSNPEFDRIGWYKSDSSVRANLDWDRFCEIEVPLPPIEKQGEYVAIYSNLLKLSSNHEKSFADLQLVADIFMESLLKEHDTETLGNYIKEAGRRNKDDSVTMQIGLENKDFVAPKVRVADDKRDTYKVIQYNEFACNLMHVGRDMRLPVGLYAENTPAIISPAYKIFKISQPDKLLPEYLLLYFKRPETDRLMAYMTDSSVRQGLEWDRLCEAKLPVPPLAVQKSIVAIYHALESRKALNERLKSTIKDISPVLIKDAKDRCMEVAA